MKGLQLPLGVQLSETASFGTFHAGPNAEIVAALAAATAGPLPPLLFIFGPKGCGKSHLLQAATRAAAATRACAYLPLARLRHENPDEALAGLASTDLLCLDDVDAVTGDAAWRLALLRLLDAVRAHGGGAVLAAAAAPDRLALELPDLRTRLSAAAVYGIRPLTDDDRAQFLVDRARARGLDLPLDAARYLLARLPRDAGSLLAALDSLDRASLSAQRRLTSAFIQQWLKEADPSLRSG